MPASTPIYSTAAEASRVVRVGAVSFKSVLVTNTGGDQYIQIHDAAELPAEGSTPICRFPIEANTTKTLVFPMFLRNGLVICNSSTLATKTIGSADCWFTAVLK